MPKGIANHSIKVFSLYEGIPLYNSKMIQSIRSVSSFSKSDAADFRLKVIEFHKIYGTKAAISAFQVSKATVYRWKKILKDSKGRLESLIPASTSPKRKRRMNTDPRIVEFIRTLREKRRIGKEKIKSLLDEECLKLSIKTLSESTIGNVKYLIF